MAALHLVNNPSALQSCVEVSAADDDILLIEDGVYAEQGVARILLALAPDVEARGLLERISETTELVSFDEFVTLVETHKPIVTWC